MTKEEFKTAIQNLIAKAKQLNKKLHAFRNNSSLQDDSEED